MTEECSEGFQVFGLKIFISTPWGTLYSIQSDRGGRGLLKTALSMIVCCIYHHMGEYITFADIRYDIICDLVSVTKVFPGFSLNLVQEFFTNSCQAYVSIMQIHLVTAVLYLKT